MNKPTKTKTAHTPTPWNFLGEPVGLGSFIHASDSIHNKIAQNVMKAEDAAFIVRAVNAHEQLLAALATMIDGYRTLASTVEEKEVWLTNPGVIRATDTFQAIAKAEGRS